jgi:hypothetical protein
VNRNSAAVPLAIDIMARPYNPNNNPRREHMLALSKLEAEGGLRESQVILGWLINTRTLTIQLPTDKYNAWKTDIDTCIRHRTAKHADRDSLVGHLNHVGTIIPLGRFFLGDLRRYTRPTKYKNRNINLNDKEIAVLLVWRNLLHRASLGINLNLLTHRKPTNITITDACPTGMGGFSVSSGKAWRWYFDDPILHLHNNTLEFIASVIGIWLEINYRDIPAFGSILALTDNNSCAGWLKKSSFRSDTKPADHAIACKVAHLLIDANIQLNVQHVPGVENIMADTLSRRSDLSNNALKSHALANFPDQVPNLFRIYQLPPRILCWASSTLRLKKPSNIGEQNQAIKNTTCHGPDGTPFSSTANYNTTPTSTDSVLPNERTLPVATCSISDTATTKAAINQPPLASQIQSRYSDALSAIPLATWQRSFGVLAGRAPFTNKHSKTNLTTE